jgi:hypothetical protein
MEVLFEVISGSIDLLCNYILIIFSFIILVVMARAHGVVSGTVEGVQSD